MGACRLPSVTRAPERIYQRSSSDGSEFSTIYLNRIINDSIATYEVSQDGYWRSPVGSLIEMQLVHFFEMREAKIAYEVVFELGRPVQSS